MTEEQTNLDITQEVGQEAADEIKSGMQRFMVEDWLIRATYKNIKRMLVWIAKQRTKYGKSRVDLFQKHESLQEGKVKDRFLRRLLKAECAYHMLGVAWYDTVKWASELWFLERLQKDEQLNQLISGVTVPTEKQREAREYIEQLLRSASAGTEVSGLPNTDSDNVWTGERGNIQTIS